MHGTPLYPLPAHQLAASPADPRTTTETVVQHPRFGGDGFLQFELRDPLAASGFSVSFRFKTDYASGLLAFLDDTSSSAFAAVVLQRGMVRLQYFGILGPETAFSTSKAVLSDDRWHEMVITVGGGADEITVDGQLSTKIPTDARDVLLALAGRGRLWIGGISSSVAESPLSAATRSFRGCHTTLTVNGGAVALSSAVAGLNVGDCDPNPCNTGPCENNGACSAVSETVFKCRCQAGFTGNRCQGGLSLDDGSLRQGADHAPDAPLCCSMLACRSSHLSWSPRLA